MGHDMQGKRVLITGGNSGIGRVTAVELAKQGAEIVLACRASAKTEAALAEIGAHGPAVNIETDLSSLASVRTSAREVVERYDRLDVLLNNAGTFPSELTLTQEGYETQFGVNHLAHFLLTHELIDLLKASAPARIINVTSTMHRRGSIDFDSFHGGGKYRAMAAYCQSKLANVMFTLSLAEKLEGTWVTVNCLHPGGVRTDIMRDSPAPVRWIVGLFFIPVEKGALTNIMLAGDPELEQVNGAYYDQCKPAKYLAVADDAELRNRLWRESERLAGVSAW